ncbi:glycosyl transferase [Adhaeribacter swui]|uniref:Peptide O-xylosyltransferase n=1 Tax=Adhaeribacter swui TaxID=2086471 RepID=A0A7G7GAB9_9BACT|nr:beta-1,6-N-acetylglucosaminyltransferase [Adhaeribacter swui]QNF34103.1 glycosyl transferase [Adhaeribacter swui]
MKLAHLILTHNHPDHLKRLIQRLTYGDDVIFIHVDKKVDITTFHNLISNKNVFFIKNRTSIDWGAFNIVKATLKSFQEILHSGTEYQYINLLSGSDYPLQMPVTIHQFLTDHPGKAFMNYRFIYDDWQEAIPRINEYHLNNYQFPGRYKVQKIMNRLLPTRTMPYGLVPVGRSQWFTIPTECVKYILEYWATHPALRRFTRLTWAPDEFIFQTILYNSEYRHILINNDLRLIDWSEGKASPKTFTLKDKDQLLSSDKLFARKFDSKNCPEILDCLDKKLISVPQVSPV